MAIDERMFAQPPEPMPGAIAIAPWAIVGALAALVCLAM
jgi:hypothetical protein